MNRQPLRACAPAINNRAPVTVPPINQRSSELDRIIAEYAGDAIAELHASSSIFTAEDHAWVRNNAAASLSEIRKATQRQVSLRTSRNLSRAAERLGMAPVSLSRWLGPDLRHHHEAEGRVPIVV